VLVVKKVEKWVTDLLLYLGALPVSERPFNKKDGSEEMLWQR
jgi:hypothetical protein